MQSVIGFGMAPVGSPDDDKEMKQKKFAQELQDQIRQRDEARFKEEIRKRGKLPGYLFDEKDEVPQPTFKKKQQMQSFHDSQDAQPPASNY